jgi:hypothetical protein
LTPKYFAFRDVIGKYLPLPPSAVIYDPIVPKGNYGKVQMKFISSFFASNGTLLLKAASGQKYPMTFEQLDQENGFVLYETQIRQLFTDPAKLEIEGKIFQFFFF